MLDAPQPTEAPAEAAPRNAACDKGLDLIQLHHTWRNAYSSFFAEGGDDAYDAGTEKRFAAAGQMAEIPATTLREFALKAQTYLADLDYCWQGKEQVKLGLSLLDDATRIVEETQQ